MLDEKVLVSVKDHDTVVDCLTVFLASTGFSDGYVYDSDEWDLISLRKYPNDPTWYALVSLHTDPPMATEVLYEIHGVDHDAVVVKVGDSENDFPERIGEVITCQDIFDTLKNMHSHIEEIKTHNSLSLTKFSDLDDAILMCKQGMSGLVERLNRLEVWMHEQKAKQG